MQFEPTAIVYGSRIPAVRTLVILPGFGSPPLAFTGYMSNTQQNLDTTTVLIQYGLSFTSFEELARTIWSLLLSLGYATNIILMGYSMGGMIAQILAKQQPRDISAVVLVSTGDCDKWTAVIHTQSQSAERFA